jgi:hypothetical protein
MERKGFAGHAAVPTSLVSSALLPILGETLIGLDFTFLIMGM